jgi:hypothetical protein
MQRLWNLDFHVQLNVWFYDLNLKTFFVACNDTHFESRISFLKIQKQTRCKTIFSCLFSHCMQHSTSWFISMSTQYRHHIFSRTKRIIFNIKLLVRNFACKSSLHRHQIQKSTKSLHVIIISLSCEFNLNWNWFDVFSFW